MNNDCGLTVVECGLRIAECDGRICMCTCERGREEGGHRHAAVERGE